MVFFGCFVGVQVKEKRLKSSKGILFAQKEGYLPPNIIKLKPLNLWSPENPLKNIQILRVPTRGFNGPYGTFRGI